MWWKLQPIRQKAPAFAAGIPPGGARDAVWVEPALVTEVAYGHWTPGGLLRHAVFKGLREDKVPEEVKAPTVVSEDATPEPQRKSVSKARAGVRLKPAQPASKGAARPRTAAKLHTAREEPSLGVPRENILQLLPDAVVPTRDALFAYWEKVGERALEHLGNRPLKLVFHRHGTTYFHKGPLPPIPSVVNQLRIEKREGGEGVRLWIDSVEGLFGLVEMGVVEVHPWGATIEDIEHLDLLVLDLDPGEGVASEFVTDTALRLRDMLADESLSCWAKTTGGKGFHLMVPVDRTRTADEGRVYARSIVQRLAQSDPSRYTISADPNKRDNRIFLDYLRNGRGTTAIGAYSPRARPGFPVAMPITWRDVENGIRPDAFTMQQLLSERPRKKRSRS